MLANFLPKKFTIKMGNFWPKSKGMGCHLDQNFVVPKLISFALKIRLSKLGLETENIAVILQVLMVFLIRKN